MKKYLRATWWTLMFAGLAQAQQITNSKLTASEGSKADEFGNAVAIEGDQILVGAHRDRPSGSFSGSAYIFQFDEGGWREKQKLVASDVSSYAQFGWDVALSGANAIVGACGDRHAGKESGAAYFFQFENGQWNELQKVVKKDAERDDLFGFSVAIEGNIAVVGVKGDNGGSGSAYVYELDGKSWVEVAELGASDSESGDAFGADVAIAGEHIAIGAPERDEKGKKSGAVYIFQRKGAAWIESAKLTANDAAEEDEFGGSIAFDGERLVVGAHLNDEKGADAGAVYIFHLQSNAWKEERKLTAKTGAAGDQFGCDVSISGNNLVVAASGDDDKGQDAGAAYLFAKNGDDWQEQEKLLANDGAENDAFGVSGAIDGNRFVVGAWLEDVGAENTGAAYVFESGTAVSVPENNLTPNAFALEQNYPNPFNPSTIIRYKLLHTSKVGLAIYNRTGQKVRTLVHENQYPGVYEVRWNGRNEQGLRVPSGQYFYSLNLGEFVQTRKMIYLK